MSTHETIPLQTELPITDGGRGFAGAAGSRLLGPLRDEVEKAQINARLVLNRMSENSKESMLWDSCWEAVELFDPVGPVAKEVRHQIFLAEENRDGYDTWPQADLDAHIAEMRRVSEALSKLESTLRRLARAEADELAQQNSANESDQRRL